MTAGPADRRAARWWPALLALPVLCCAGHAVLLAVGFGSISAAVGGVTGSAVLVVVALLLLAAALLLVRRRHKQNA